MEVIVDIEIERPRQQVAAFASDPHNDTEWIVNIKEVEWKTEPPVQKGTAISRVAYFLGKRLAYTYVVDDFVPGELLAMRATDGPFPMTTDYRWEDAGQGTKMTITVGGGPGGFFGLATPLLKAQMRRALNKDLAKIKQILEAR